MMQRTYFLGGASPSGFSTSFWTAHRDCYGYYLKGGPGTGKSTLMKKIAAAFSGEDISCWHCASDPRSLDAVVLEERGVFIADATAPHESGTSLPYVTGETVDLAAGLSPAVLQENRTEILRLYRENQSAHMQARKGIAGIAEMEEIIADTGALALQQEKLHGFAARLGKRLIPRANGQQGDVLSRQSAALTPEGYLRYLPEGFDLILIHDPLRIAGAVLLRQLAEYAAGSGNLCEVTQALTRPDFPPVMLILPAQQLILAAVTELSAPDLPAPVSCIRMQRFYDAALLKKHRSLLRFCSRTAAQTEQRVIALLSDALQIHDDLESYYIRALNPAFLDRTAATMIQRIAS
jgi:hypothetical protein